ncbi:hypothetical protein ACFW1A_00680 [Kitasatospora sp. NPDC058965]|uniref:hypothetical protein n=1 Tax=Kitasatospora sp. NPDC058965 TaxID=3346682 RepID=UPI0036A2B204
MSANAILSSRPPAARPRPAAGRRWLRAVPTQQEAPEALLLGEGMRVRLAGAVRALLADESVAGLPDAARLAAVVLLAKGCVEQGRTVIWSGELARWLGVSVSMVSHKVLPPLRARGVVTTQVETDDDGQPVALRIVLEPVGRLRRARDQRHPLALTRKELSVLLRLCEALFGPGWAPKGKAEIPAGLLAREERRGHGAATDRLALLLLVLSCRENGWVRLCAGSLKAPEAGRGAATLALLLRGGTAEVSPVAAGRVLTRFQDGGLVEVERDDDGVPTGRVRLLPVAERYAAVRSAGKAQASGAVGRSGKRAVRLVGPRAAESCPDEEANRSGSAVSSSAVGSAEGDLGRLPAPADGLSGLLPAEMPGGEGGAAVSEGADFHAHHTLVADVGGCADVVDGDSGACAVGVTHRRPERVGGREDAADSGVPALRLVGAEEDPLRGDKPQHDVQHHQHQEQRGGRAARVVGLPRDAAVARALVPVQDLWQRLEGASTRGFLVKRVRLALNAVALWAGQDDAPEVLAERLAFRRERQVAQGNPYVGDPIAWLLERGLPQERQCRHQACDNGVRLDSGEHCTTCDLRIQDRRSSRRAVIGQVVGQLPQASFEDRQGAIEAALRSHALVRVEAQVDAGRREAEAQARWEAQRPEREVRAALAEAERLAVPCADCGAGQAAGLCRGCARGREIRQGVHECISVTLAGFADLSSYGSFRQVWERTRVELRQARLEARNGAVDEQIGGASELLAVQHALGKYRAAALRVFASSEAAQAEAEGAYQTVMRSRHRYSSAEAALEAAVEESGAAQLRAAEWLLKRRVASVEELRSRIAARGGNGGPGVRTEADPYTNGANRVRAAVNAHSAGACAGQGR